MNKSVIREDLTLTRTEATAVECLEQFALSHVVPEYTNDSDIELSAAAGVFKNAYIDSGKKWPEPCDDFQRRFGFWACCVKDNRASLQSEISGARYVVRAMFERFEFQCERVD